MVKKNATDSLGKRSAVATRSRLPLLLVQRAVGAIRPDGNESERLIAAESLVGEPVNLPRPGFQRRARGQASARSATKGGGDACPQTLMELPATRETLKVKLTKMSLSTSTSPTLGHVVLSSTVSEVNAGGPSSQCVPLPTAPSGHSHSNEPGVLWHRALRSQLCRAPTGPGSASPSHS